MKKAAIVLFVFFVMMVALTIAFFPTPSRLRIDQNPFPAADSAPVPSVQVGAPATPQVKPQDAPSDTPSDVPSMATAASAQPTPTPRPTPTASATPEPTPSATPEVVRPTPTPIPSFEPAYEPVIDTSETDKAVIILRYYNDNGKRVKMRLSRGGKTYTYDIQPNNVPTRFPLNLGTGDYNVEFLENVSGKQYRSIFKGSFHAEWEGKYTPYLQSVQNINWDPSMDPIIDALVLAIEAGETGKIQAIYEELARTLYYDFDVYENQSLPAGYLPDIEHTYETRLGICYDMSSLLAGMLRANGVPVKLMMGYSDNVYGYHAWNEVLVDDTWVIVDLTVDSIFREDGKEFNFSKKESEYSPDKEY